MGVNVQRLEAITCGVDRLCVCFQELALLLSELIAQRNLDLVCSGLRTLLAQDVCADVFGSHLLCFFCVLCYSTILFYAITVHFALMCPE